MPNRIGLYQSRGGQFNWHTIRAAHSISSNSINFILLMILLPGGYLIGSDIHLPSKLNIKFEFSLAQSSIHIYNFPVHKSGRYLSQRPVTHPVQLFR